MLYCDTYLLISYYHIWLFGNLCCFLWHDFYCGASPRPGCAHAMLPGPLLDCADIGGSLTFMCKYLYCSD